MVGGHWAIISCLSIRPNAAKLVQRVTSKANNCKLEQFGATFAEGRICVTKLDDYIGNMQCSLRGKDSIINCEDDSGAFKSFSQFSQLAFDDWTAVALATALSAFLLNSEATKTARFL